VGFVRWTEQRNFEAVLDMLADGRLDVKPLISHQFDLEQIASAYTVVAGSEPSMGVMLNYRTRTEMPDEIMRERTVSLSNSVFQSDKKSLLNLAFIGSGNYATAVLIPAFKKAGAHLCSIASNSGVSSVHAGNKYGFKETTTDTNKLFTDQDIDALVISTRHDSHATLVLQALRAGKQVFVEKPLCLTLTELNEIEQAYASLKGTNSKSPILMVGFNRRFAPQVQKMKSLLLAVSGPKSFVMTVNAGSIPMNHWTQDLEIGGGRIIGEACHFIDLLRFLSGSPITGWQILGMDCATKDTASLQLQFADGSIGTIHYFANGSKTFPKERLEVFAAGGVLQLDNFRRLSGYGWPGFKKMNLWRQDKGQGACAKAFLAAVEGNVTAPIPFEEVLEVSRVSIELAGGEYETN
jgi:hypothetical protein